jgi:hypothetical protein
MKLVYSREGGLFAQPVQTEIQSTDLPVDLQQLVDTVLAQPAAYSPAVASATLRDGYQYRLDLTEGRKKICLRFDDLSLPDDVQPLIHFLQQRTGKP